MSGIDWEAAFDRGDPTTAIKKFIKLGLRPSLVTLLGNYLTGRKMTVNYNNAKSSIIIIDLIGGFPQGSVIGGDTFVVTTDDSADFVDEEHRFKYIDDLEILELVTVTGVLQDYDIWSHVPSDIGIDQKYLCPSKYQTQDHLNSIQDWSEQNLTKINTEKSNYMLFYTCREDIATRLTVNNIKIDQKAVNKILGVWVSEDVGNWEVNISEMSKKAYARILMLSKLKYAGVPMEDLVHIYCVFIRSQIEYCTSAIIRNQSLELLLN